MKRIYFLILALSVIATRQGFSQNQKISEMTSATSITGPEYVPIVQSGVNKKLTFSTLGFGNFSANRIPVASNAYNLTSYSNFTYNGTLLNVGTGGTPFVTPVTFQSMYTSSSGTASNINALFQTDQTAASTGSAIAIEGVAQTTHATGTVSNAIGTLGYFNHTGAGTVTSARSFQGGGILASGTITNAYGLYTSFNITGTGTATNYYGAYLTSPSIGSGTITNRWGLYSEDTSAKNYFGGNVGIGTTSPNAPLQFSSSTANRKIVLYETANNDHEYYGFGVNTSPSALRYQSDANHIFYTGTSSTTSTELARFTSDGKFGIGVDPSVTLHTNGAARIGGTGGMSIGNDTGQNRIDSQGSAATPFRFLNISNAYTGIEIGGLSIKTAPTNDDTETSILVRQSDGEIQTRAASSLATSLTSTHVGYGSGANAVTGEAAFTYDASVNTLSVDEISCTSVTSTEINMNSTNDGVRMWRTADNVATASFFNDSGAGDAVRWHIHQDQVLTTNATVTTLNAISVPSTGIISFEGTIVARRTGGTAGASNDAAVYTFVGAAKGSGGTASLFGTPTLTVVAEDQAAWNVTFTASSSSILVEVTGAANNNITWNLVALRVGQAIN